MMLALILHISPDLLQLMQLSLQLTDEMENYVQSNPGPSS